MARGGIDKALVQTARLALLARGEYPSIDAVRVEMGNTGSKTTIHRHLKELNDGDEKRNAQPPIGDELTELVTRLAGRLQGQAQESIAQAQTDFDAATRVLNEELLATQKQLAETADRLSQESRELAKRTADLLDTRQQLQTAQTANVRLTQANQDMAERLNDKNEHIRSLDEQLLHARDSLVQYRNTTRTQREQEQIRHEGQTQTLKIELSDALGFVRQRQDELTLIARDNERLLAKAATAEREQNTLNAALEAANKVAASATERCQHSESRCALLEERASVAKQEAADARQQLTDQQQQNRVIELILIKTELALDSLRNAQPLTPTE